MYIVFLFVYLKTDLGPVSLIKHARVSIRERVCVYKRESTREYERVRESMRESVCDERVVLSELFCAIKSIENQRVEIK